MTKELAGIREKVEAAEPLSADDGLHLFASQIS